MWRFAFALFWASTPEPGVFQVKLGAGEQKLRPATAPWTYNNVLFNFSLSWSDQHVGRREVLVISLVYLFITRWTKCLCARGDRHSAESRCECVYVKWRCRRWSVLRGEVGSNLFPQQHSPHRHRSNQRRVSVQLGFSFSPGLTSSLCFLRRLLTSAETCRVQRPENMQISLLCLLALMQTDGYQRPPACIRSEIRTWWFKE